MRRNQHCEIPFILDNGCTWRIIEYEFDNNGAGWIFTVEVVCDVCSEFRVLRVTLTGEAVETQAIERARAAIWQFLNENRQQLSRSRWTYAGNVTVETL